MSMRTVYLGRANTFALALEGNGQPRPASDYNRFVLHMKDPTTGTVIEIDSSTAPAGTFDTSISTFFKGKKVSVLTCKLGLGSFGLVADKNYETWLRVYNAQITQGLVWPDDNDTVRIKVLNGP